MAITAEQRIARQKAIGSSDAATVMGLNPYQSIADLWLEKTGRATGFDGNAATDRGNLLEPVLVTYAELELGIPLERNVTVHSNDYPILVANLDALAVELPASVEAKSSTMNEDWGEDGTDEVPERVSIQVHHQMVCVGPHCRVAYVPVLLPGFRSFDFRMYRVERNDAIANGIIEACMTFWDKYVVTDTPPDDYRPSLEVLKRVRRVPNKIVEIPGDLVKDYEIASALAKSADKQKKDAQAALIAALGDAEAGTHSGGQVTYFATKKKGYFVEESEYRSIRLKSK